MPFICCCFSLFCLVYITDSTDDAIHAVIAKYGHCHYCADYLQEAYVSLLEHTNSLLSDSHSHSQSLTQSPPNDDAYAKYLRLLPSATSGSSEAAAAAATVASASSKVPGTDMKICRAYNLLLTEK